MSNGKRNGSLVPAEFEDEAFLTKLDPVVEQLKADVPDAKYDRKSLAQLMLQLRQFMESVMGKNGVAKTYPKLPASLFKDFRPDGAVAIIASRLHQFKKTRGIRQIDWNNPGMRRQVLEIVNHCRRELEKLKLIKPPIILLHPSLGPGESDRAKEAAAKMGGQLASAEDDPNITHVVYPFGPKGDPDDGKDYMRVLEFKGNKALVHWWYLPDSYDEFIVREADMALDAERSPAGPWKVYVRWLTDSEKYNEWMNPVDYETEEAVEAHESKAPAPQPASLPAPASQPKAKAEPVPAPTPASRQQQQTLGPPRPPLPVRPPAATPPPHQDVSITCADGALNSQPGSAQQQQTGPPRPAPPTVPTAAAAAAAGVAAAAAGQSPMAPVQAPKRPAPSAAVPTAAAAARGAWAGVRARGAAVDYGQPAKRLKAEHEIMEVAPGTATRLTPYAVRHKSVEVHRSAIDGSLAIEGMSHGQIRLGDGPYGQPPRISPFPEVATQSATGPQAEDATRPKGVALSTLLVPKHAAWFRWHAISKVEEEALPEFFTGTFPSKTPGVYRKYREALINAYRAKPFQVLTLTRARQLVVGDNAIVAKVWGFLNHWGLINFQASKPGARITGALEGNASYLLSLKQPTQLEAINALGSGGRSLALKRSQHRAKALQPQVSALNPPKFLCSVMPWVDCTALRYHCVKHPDVNLCPEAFAKGLFPAGCSSKDFVRIDHKDQANVPDEDKWTPSELLLLLEGIELFGEEWAAVAEHVGDKMPSQCVQRFLSLPIDDVLLDELEQGPAVPSTLQAPAGSAAATAHAPPPSGLRIPVPTVQSSPSQPPSDVPDTQAEADELAQLATAACSGDEAACAKVEEYVLGQLEVPFAEHPNPLLAQVALFSLALGPQIAGAAAEASLVALDHAAKSGGKDLEQVSLSTQIVDRAAAAALVGAVVRAKQLVDEEEFEMREQVVKIVHLYINQMDQKLSSLEELEKAIERERAQSETQTNQINSKLKVLREARLGKGS